MTLTTGFIIYLISVELLALFVGFIVGAITTAIIFICCRDKTSKKRKHSNTTEC